MLKGAEWNSFNVLKLTQSSSYEKVILLLKALSGALSGAPERAPERAFSRRITFS